MLNIAEQRIKRWKQDTSTKPGLSSFAQMMISSWSISRQETWEHGTRVSGVCLRRQALRKCTYCLGGQRLREVPCMASNL